jgi:Universal stress protein family
VVGASGTRASRAAVAFAAAEAVRRNVPLYLLRLEQPAPAGASSPDMQERLFRADNELALEVSALRSERPDLVVVADLACGEAAEVLPAYSDSSTILVVGCHHSEDHWSTWLGPIATSVVHRNRGAVVVVGHAWNQNSYPAVALPGCQQLGVSHR